MPPSAPHQAARCASNAAAPALRRQFGFYSQITGQPRAGPPSLAAVREAWRLEGRRCKNSSPWVAVGRLGPRRYSARVVDGRYAQPQIAAITVRRGSRVRQSVGGEAHCLEPPMPARSHNRSAGVALASVYPNPKSAGHWLLDGWRVTVAFAGFFVMLAVLGWHPNPPHRRGVELPTPSAIGALHKGPGLFRSLCPSALAAKGCTASARPPVRPPRARRDWQRAAQPRPRELRS